MARYRHEGDFARIPVQPDSGDDTRALRDLRHIRKDISAIKILGCAAVLVALFIYLGQLIYGAL